MTRTSFTHHIWRRQNLIIYTSGAAESAFKNQTDGYRVRARSLQQAYTIWRMWLSYVAAAYREDTRAQLGVIMSRARERLPTSKAARRTVPDVPETKVNGLSSPILQYMTDHIFFRATKLRQIPMKTTRARTASLLLCRPLALPALDFRTFHFTSDCSPACTSVLVNTSLDRKWYRIMIIRVMVCRTRG